MSEVQSSDNEDPVAAAAERLERAVARVSTRLEDMAQRLKAAESDVGAARDTDADRARLAAALDEARAREAELGAAAQEAAEALDAAMEDLRIVLEDDKDGS